MFTRHAVDFSYMCPLMKCEANWALNSLKILMELGVNLLNQILMEPNPRGTFQRSREGPTYDLIRHSLQVH